MRRLIPGSTSHRARGDRGAFLIIFALTITVIIIFVAFAVDLGQARASQRSNRSTVDLAALSAGFWLAGGEFTGLQPVADAQKACAAAVTSVQTNEPKFVPTQPVATTCATLPACDPVAPPSSQPVPIVFTDAAGLFRLEIQYPVLDGAAGGLDDDRFSGAGANDGDDPCERMRISLQRLDRAAFAGLIDYPTLKTRGSVVVRGEIEDPREEAIPAFLMLDRTACGSIATLVGDGDGITVKATKNLKGEPQPGYMHSDSNATTGCSAKPEESVAIYGGNSKSPESIILESIEDDLGNTVDGVVESRTDASKGVGGWVRGTYRTGGIISRQPADDIYGASIVGSHAAARIALNFVKTASEATAQGYDVRDCSGALVGPGGSTSVFIDCPSLDAALDLPSYTESVVFGGNVDLAGGRDVMLAQARNVTVRGFVKATGGGSNKAVFDAPAAENVVVAGGLNIPNNGVFAVNRGGPAPLTTPSEDPTCPARALAPASTTIGNTARVVVFSTGTAPAVEVAGNLTLCEATLFLAGNTSSTSYQREIAPATAECLPTKPCPKSGALPSARYYFASGATVRLVGPNTNPDPPPTTGWQWTTGQSGGIEDLAFWSETGGLSEVRGGASLTINGVFSAPNGTLEFRSGPASTDPVDAQFIARTLKMFAGKLSMLPTAANSVPVPVPGSFSLIR